MVLGLGPAVVNRDLLAPAPTEAAQHRPPGHEGEHAKERNRQGDRAAQPVSLVVFALGARALFALGARDIAADVGGRQDRGLFDVLVDLGGEPHPTEDHHQQTDDDQDAGEGLA